MRTNGRGPGGETPDCTSRRHDSEAAPAPVVRGLRICAACRDQVEAQLVDLS